MKLPVRSKLVNKQRLDEIVAANNFSDDQRNELHYMLGMLADTAQAGA